MGLVVPSARVYEGNRASPCFPARRAGQRNIPAPEVYPIYVQQRSVAGLFAIRFHIQAAATAPAGIPKSAQNSPATSPAPPLAGKGRVRGLPHFCRIRPLSEG